MKARRIQFDEAVRIVIERSEKLIANGKNPKKIINLNKKVIETIKKDLRKYDACFDGENFGWFEKKR